MWCPANICEQWERNLSFGSADVSGTGTRDEPLRTSAWEAKFCMVYGIFFSKEEKSNSLDLTDCVNAFAFCFVLNFFFSG